MNIVPLVGFLYVGVNLRFIFSGFSSRLSLLTMPSSRRWISSFPSIPSIASSSLLEQNVMNWAAYMCMRLFITPTVLIRTVPPLDAISSLAFVPVIFSLRKIECNTDDRISADNKKGSVGSSPIRRPLLVRFKRWFTYFILEQLFELRSPFLWHSPKTYVFASVVPFCSSPIRHVLFAATVYNPYFGKHFALLFLLQLSTLRAILSRSNFEQFEVPKWVKVCFVHLSLPGAAGWCVLLSKKGKQFTFLQSNVEALLLQVHGTLSVPRIDELRHHSLWNEGITHVFITYRKWFSSTLQKWAARNKELLILFWSLSPEVYYLTNRLSLHFHTSWKWRPASSH